MWDKFLTKQIYIVLLIVVGLITFSKVINFGFVWDDNELYLNKTNYPEANKLQNISKFWTPGQMPMYAPVTYTVWGLIAQVSSEDETNNFKLSPKFFHIVNLIFHILNSILILLIISKLFNNNLASFFSALIFLIHPLQVESVSWISELRGLLAGFFGFFAIYLHISGNIVRQDESKQKSVTKINKSNDKFNYIHETGIIILLILAMLSKPTAVVFPLIIFLLDYFLQPKNTFKQSIIRLITSLALMIPIIILSMMAEGNAAKIANTPFYQKPLIAIDSLIFYLQKVLIPINLSPVYGRTVAFISSGSAIYISLLIFVVITALLWYFRKKSNWLIVSFLIIIVGILPVSGLVDFYYQSFSTVADRYFYISMFGVSVILAYLFSIITANSTKYAVILIAGLLLFLQSSSTADTWMNELSLWNKVIGVNPEASYQAYLGRGEYYVTASNYTNAIDDFTNAIRLNKSENRSYYNRANAFLDLKQYEKAIRDYSQAILINHNDVNSYTNRGTAYYETEQFSLAESDFRKALSINQDQYDLLNRLGVIFASRKQYDSALVYFNQAYRLNPNDSEINENLKHINDIIKKGN